MKIEKDTKKVSVVVPCFNAAEYLHHCVDHLLRQTIGLENIEIILVDDASTDGGATWDVIMQYESRYPDSIIAIRGGRISDRAALEMWEYPTQAVNI